MKQWEFLLQKQGDRAWLPLESSSAEILEGRYRIVARSSRLDVPVEVQVSRVGMTPSGLPRRITRKRVARTNPTGLLAIIPFTTLRPGLWEFRCSNDLMSDFVGERWQHRIQLQVLPHTAGEEEDLGEDDWEMTDPLPDDSPQSPSAQIRLTTVDQERAIANLADHFANTLAYPDATPATAPHPDIPKATDEPPAEDTPHEDAQEIAGDEAEVESGSTQSGPIAVASFSANLASDPEPDSESNPAPPTDQIPAHEAASATHAADLGALSPDRTADSDRPPLDPAQLRSLAETTSQQVVDEAFAAWADTLDRPDAAPAAAPTPEYAPILIDGQTLQFRLQTDVFTVQDASSIVLTGEIGLDGASTTTILLLGSTVTVRLIDPQTSRAIATTTHTLPAHPLPMPVEVAVPIAAESETYLLLGEVMVAVQHQGRTHQLAPAAFTVTFSADYLLNAIANQAEQDELFADPPDEPAPEPTGRALAVFDPSALTPAPIVLDPSQFQPSLSSPLPPLLQPPESPAPPPVAAPRSATEPKLPIFPTATPPAQPPREAPAIAASSDERAENATISATTEDESSAPPLGDPAVAGDEVVDHAIGEDVDAPLATTPAPEITVPESAETEITSASEPDQATDSPAFEPPPVWEPTPPEPEPDPDDFAALNLQQRFFSRLTALAATTEPEPETPMVPLTPVPPVEEPEPPPPAAIAPFPQPDWAAIRAAEERQQREAELNATEVVIYEDDVSPPADPGVAPPIEANSATTPAPSAPALPSSTDFDEAYPLPCPTLGIPDGTLTAGQPLPIRIELPSLPLRTYVKFWMTDRQTRSVLETPRWLADFIPLEGDRVTADLELTVPQGCLEILFEAVTVEVATQRQSAKTSIYRAIIPANLPNVAFNEFDL